VCTFSAGISHKTRLGQNPSLVPFNDPSLHVKLFSRRDSVAKPDSQLDCEGFPTTRDDGLRHGFIEDRRDDAAMDGPLEALPTLLRNPPRTNPIRTCLERELQTVWVLSSADDAVGIEGCKPAGNPGRKDLAVPR
jgi:hypothetical protein